VAFSCILLKNAGNALPFPGSSKKYAIIGDRGHTRALAVGSGSGHVEPSHIFTTYEGISKAAPLGSKVTYVDSNSYRSKAALVAQVDYAIVAVGATSGEGFDRDNLKLEEDDMIAWVAARHRHVIVTVVAPGAVLMPWADHPNISAIVLQVLSFFHTFNLAGSTTSKQTNKELTFVKYIYSLCLGKRLGMD